MIEKELLLSITSEDLDIQYSKDADVNGEYTALITHHDSGASVTWKSRERRKVVDSDAFKKIIKSDMFRYWHRAEVQKKIFKSLSLCTEMAQ